MKAALQWLLNAWSRKRRVRAENAAIAQRVAGAYRTAFDPAREDARKVLADLALYCNVQHTSFVPGDPYQTALNEGRRDVFNHIAGILELTPQDFETLFQEQAQ